MKYFKHDLVTRDDDKIFELIEAHGVQGYGIWWVILEELYKSEDGGFQIAVTDTWFKRLSKSLNLTDWRILLRTLDTMAEIRLIDPQLWAEHVIHAPGISKRADQYLRQKERAAERKRLQRERQRQAKESQMSRVTSPVSRVTDMGHEQCHTTVTTNTDPDLDLDLKDPPFIPPYGDGTKAIFQAKPWREGGSIRKDFCKFVGDQLPANDERDMHPVTKGRNHIINLEKGRQWGDFEKLQGYWDDFCSRTLSDAVLADAPSQRRMTRTEFEAWLAEEPRRLSQRNVYEQFFEIVEDLQNAS